MSLGGFVFLSGGVLAATISSFAYENPKKIRKIYTRTMFFWLILYYIVIQAIF